MHKIWMKGWMNSIRRWMSTTLATATKAYPEKNTSSFDYIRNNLHQDISSARCRDITYLDVYGICCMHNIHLFHYFHADANVRLHGFIWMNALKIRHSAKHLVFSAQNRNRDRVKSEINLHRDM